MFCMKTTTNKTARKIANVARKLDEIQMLLQDLREELPADSRYSITEAVVATIKAGALAARAAEDAA